MSEQAATSQPVKKDTQVEKKAKAPKSADASDKKNQKKSFDSYSLYVNRVLKTVHNDIGITSKAINVMDSFVRDIFERIAREASDLARNNDKSTITVKEIETATKLVLSGDLAKHAVSEGQHAVDRVNGKGSSAHSKA